MLYVRSFSFLVSFCAIFLTLEVAAARTLSVSPLPVLTCMNDEGGSGCGGGVSTPTCAKPGNYLRIETTEQFLGMLDPNSNYILCNDLDFQNQTVLVNRDLFFNGAVFNGHFYGNRKIIRNMGVSGYQRNTSVFGAIGPNGKITNLILENVLSASINGKSALVAGKNHGIISFVEIKNSTTYFAGIAIENTTSGKISNVKVDSLSNPYLYKAGVAFRNYGLIDQVGVENSNFSSNDGVTGIVWQNYGAISNSYLGGRWIAYEI